MFNKENSTDILVQSTIIDMIASGKLGKPILLISNEKQVLIHSKQIVEVKTMDDGIEISYISACQYTMQGFSNQLKTFRTNLMTISDIKNLLE